MKMILFFLLWPLFSKASLEVAFIEIKTPKGDIVQLEPNGQFAHIAISYQNKWLHAHPYRGVELVNQKELEKIGTIKKILPLSQTRPLEESEVLSFLHKPYDSLFSWNNDRIYCSELVAKLLHIPPTPMIFEGPHWDSGVSYPEGEFGLSPDDIYQYLLEQKGVLRTDLEIKSPTCSRILK